MLSNPDDELWSLNTPSLEAATESSRESELETSASEYSIPSSMPSLLPPSEGPYVESEAHCELTEEGELEEPAAGNNAAEFLDGVDAQGSGVERLEVDGGEPGPREDNAEAQRMMRLTVWLDATARLRERASSPVNWSAQQQPADGADPSGADRWQVRTHPTHDEGQSH
ncbi:unnamed protein product [Peniophora sp. CBMAI 1063]|nr:unnamed protein product [Peniophora sp. CBMAI 1063]